MRIDIDRIISEIEQLERIFSEPDTRALSACDLAAANRRHDEKQARSPWFQLFVLIALNCALRNGDAHLKNFGIVYDDVQGGARLAPVYDLVTTSVYLPKDSMAPTLNGTTKWASAKELQPLGETRMGGTPACVREILQRIEAAIADTSKELHAYIKAHPEFIEIGNRMLQQWEQGVALSLKAA